MRCHSCENKKTPADCLVSPQFNLDQFNLDLNRDDGIYRDFYKFRKLHQKSQLSCLAECFLMDGNWCNIRLPIPEVKSPYSEYPQYPSLLTFANEDTSGISYDTYVQTRF